MYLFTHLPLVLSILSSTYADCGCSTNRHGQCNKENSDASLKYSRKSNEDDNTQKVHLDTSNMVLIEGTTFEMGTNKPIFESDHEGPMRNVSVKSFYLDMYEVSNQNFYDFIKETGYQTEAEKFGDSFIFEMVLPENQRENYKDVRAVQAPWWIKMNGAYWKHPEGQGSTIEGRMNHPVVHVSWNDAVKYCEYFGKRLPTESEWEMACRSGLRRKLYPWGNKLNPKGKHWANIWQGEFPKMNTEEDGYGFTCPVDEFPPNKFGLYNMAGNVWEWTQDNWLGHPVSILKIFIRLYCDSVYEKNISKNVLCLMASFYSGIDTQVSQCKYSKRKSCFQSGLPVSHDTFVEPCSIFPAYRKQGSTNNPGW